MATHSNRLFREPRNYCHYYYHRNIIVPKNVVQFQCQIGTSYPRSFFVVAGKPLKFSSEKPCLSLCLLCATNHTTLLLNVTANLGFDSWSNKQIGPWNHFAAIIQWSSPFICHCSKGTTLFLCANIVTKNFFSLNLRGFENLDIWLHCVVQFAGLVQTHLLQ